MVSATKLPASSYVGPRKIEGVTEELLSKLSPGAKALLEAKPVEIKASKVNSIKTDSTVVAITPVKTALNKDDATKTVEEKSPAGKGSQISKPVLQKRLKLFCPVCHASFATHAAINLHLAASHPNFKTYRTKAKPTKALDLVVNTVVVDNLKQKGELDKPKRTSKSGVTIFCPVCDEPFDHHTAMKHHLKTAHPDRKEEASKRFCRFLECSICTKYFVSTNETAIQTHFDTFHAGEPLQYTRVVKQKDDAGPYLCPHCGMTFVSGPVLRNHILIHGEKRFICKICGKRFAQPAGLTVHMDGVHGEKKFIQNSTNPCKMCDVCGKMFSPIALYQHHRAVHQGKRQVSKKPQFECDYCAYKTHIRNYLKSHMSKHTGERSYVCGCGKEFAWYRSLSGHKKKCSSG